jgi:hypothetical protein
LFDQNDIFWTPFLEFYFHVTEVNSSLSIDDEDFSDVLFWPQNLPLIDSNEKTESAEDEIPNNNANDLHVRHSLVEETGQVEGKRTDEQIHKSDGISVHEKKQLANASEAYKSTESTISDHTSTEGTVRKEMISKTSENIKELETVHRLDSEEKIEVKVAELNIPEVTNNEEAIDTEIHRTTTKSE